MDVYSQVEKLQDTVDQHSTVVSRLFPGHQLADLVLLDRCQLLQLAASTQEEQPETSTSPARETTGQHLQDSTSPSVSHLETAQSLATLDHVPELNPAADEVTRYRSTVHAVSDDVNGLSFSVDKASSYVGISSVNAVLKAIFKIAPQLQSRLAQHCPRTTQPSRAPSPSAPPSPQPANTKEIMPSPPPDVAEKHIDAYFEHIHALVPMIDEDAFRFSFLYEERVDAPWLALFNVVLAMGSLASGTCDSVEHSTYARRARQILRQRSLGSNNLLVLQAHGLLSGYYLHWLNRPNEANAMMGATMRIASAIGIHREYEISCLANNTPIPSEVRRRTWWCLVCLDTWASMTTGRPSFGRLGPGITVKRPTLPPTTNNKQYLASLKLLPLVHNIEFCTLATHVQDQLATKPMLSSEELAIQDAKLVDWHESLPPILRCVYPPFRSAQGPQYQATTTPPGDQSQLRGQQNKFQVPATEDSTCPLLLQTPRALTNWWYLTLRVLMHRPYLIAASLSRVREEQLSERDKYIISKCRRLAGQTIATIDKTCRDHLMAGWNAVWLMYQATMVPLLSLSTFYATHSSMTVETHPTDAEEQAPKDEATEWENQVKTAVCFFERMSSFSPAASKSKVVVEQLLQACKQMHMVDQDATDWQQYYHPSELDDLGPNFQGSLGDFDFSTLDFEMQDSDMGVLWNDMTWETFEGDP